MQRPKAGASLPGETGEVIIPVGIGLYGFGQGSRAGVTREGQKQRFRRRRRDKVAKKAREAVMLGARGRKHPELENMQDQLPKKRRDFQGGGVRA